MDRQIVYPGQIPLETDMLQSQRFAHTALGRFLSAVMGEAVVDGMSVGADSPASMDVIVQPGSIMVEGVSDQSAYGSLAAEPTKIFGKQGELSAAKIVPLVAPASVGQSIKYLIQVAFQESDEDATVLPYYNADDPDQPYSGPDNSGVSQYTIRRGKAVVTSKAGVSATTGTETAPAADVGYYPLAVVTVAYGQTSITSAHIVDHDDAPHLISKLPQIPHKVQSGEWIYAEATGTATAIVVDLYPNPTSYPKQMIVKAAANSVGATTITIDQIGTVPLVRAGGQAVGPNHIVAGMPMMLIFNGTSYWLMNASAQAILDDSGAGGTVSVPPPDRNIENVGDPAAFDLYIGINGLTGNYQLRKIRGVNLTITVDPDGELVITAPTAPTTLGAIAPAMMVQQKRLPSTPPTTLTNDAWMRRPINDLIINQIAGASFNSANSQITLPAGTYRANFVGMASNAGHHRARLYDVTHTAQLGVGNSADSYTGGSSTLNPSIGIARFVLTEETVVELQTYFKGSNTAKMGDSEENSPDYHIDGWVEITKEA